MILANKKSIFYSLIGHFALFLFGVSLGKSFFYLDYPKINFWGSVFRDAELNNFNSSSSSVNIYEFFKRQHLRNLILNNRFDRGYFSIEKKQLLNFSIIKDKGTYFAPSFFSCPFNIHHKHEITLYPILPKHFLFYFKDQQRANVLLSFNLIVKNRLPLVNIKRKKTSGNLEVDLLTMRYLSHYLFRIPDPDLAINQWKDVNIELTQKND